MFEPILVLRLKT